ncbi:hypothetical protein DV515_00007747 [Chloebia gouldiae]|nr:hypothetical protein DV515_00007747 [Chloebia gouldiae]
MDDSKVVGGKVKKPGKRGRKPAKIDLKAKLERSRQSARECRARKKLRYQYLEELVSSRERAICALREELEMYKQWCMAMDQGKIPSEIKALLTGEEQGKAQQNSTKLAKAAKTDANSSNPYQHENHFFNHNNLPPWCIILRRTMQNLPRCNRGGLGAGRRKNAVLKSGCIPRLCGWGFWSSRCWCKWSLVLPFATLPSPNTAMAALRHSQHKRITAGVTEDGADVEISVGGKQGKIPACQFLFFVSLSINFSKSYLSECILIKFNSAANSNAGCS